MESNNVPTTVSTSPSATSFLSNITENTRMTAGETAASEETQETTGLEDLISKLILEDENGGNGDDSDVEGDEIYDNDIANREDEEIDDDDDGKMKAMLKVTATGSMSVIGELPTDGGLGNNNLNVNIPSPPSDYVAPPLKADEPAFEAIDNPGNWHRYYFQPKFNKSKKYAGHYLPTGARPVPVGQDGSRKCCDWTFHYNRFSNQEFSYRRGATTANLFPKEMEGSLDENVLERLGLNARIMNECDALFFFQLLLPFCDTKKDNGIKNDPRMNYYNNVAKYSNVYALMNGKGTQYGHKWNNIMEPELVRFDGVLFHDGSLGGSNGAVYRRWDPKSDCYAKHIQKAMTLTRYHEIKANIKLCNNDTAPKRGSEGYNPAYKYDLIYKVLVHNTNALTKKADENQTIDESTWSHSGYGESKTGITGRIRNKKVSKGGQTVFVMDRFRFRIRGYLHRNKIYDELYADKKREGWTANGPYELKHLADKLEKMVVGENSTDKKLFEKKPCITADNFFQSDKSMEYLDLKNKQAKIARFTQPLIAVKDVEIDGKKYQRVHVSFQSTSSCNISTVNALNEVYNFVELRERGKGISKRLWVIEMNHAWRTYLLTYNSIDVLDHLIKNARLFYQTWKYWHAPKNHALAIVLAVAYDMYLEVAEGNLKEEWKIEKPVSFWEFQNILSKQMLSYSQKKKKYKGDERVRLNTQLPNCRRMQVLPDKQGNITRTQLQELTFSEKSRGCGDLDKLCSHLDSSVKIKKGRNCAFCGAKAYQGCGLCKDAKGKELALHIHTKQGGISMCFFHWHNDNQIGLAIDDQTNLRKRKRGDWEAPNRREREEQKKHITELKSRFR